MDSTDLYLEYREISSIAEGIEIGESKPAQEYHVLVRRKKHVLVTHYFWQKCEFCRREDDDGVVDLNK
jgi:hypothetical protein